MRVLGQVLPGRRPIPSHFCGFVDCHTGNVAGLAGNRVGVLVESLIDVGCLAVAVGAIDASGAVDADRHGTAGDPMVFRFVAVTAGQIGAPHMDVNPFAGEVHGAIEIAVFDGVASAALEVADAAIPTCRRPDTLSHRQQVDSLCRLAAQSLFVGPRLLVANEAVDILFLGEIEIVVEPTVSGMAGRALGNIGSGRDTEVVDEILLSDRKNLFSPRQFHTLAGPIQWLVFMRSLAASGWHSRHARVTDGPSVRGPWIR